MSNDFWKGYLTAAVISLFTILVAGNIAHCETITEIITKEALKQGLEPRVALTVATIESSLNPRAIGTKGEIGLFQIRPEYSEVSRVALLDPYVNARIGIKKLLWMKKYCALQEDLTYVICFNQGMRKPHFPLLHPYYKRFIIMWAKQ